MHDPMVVAFEIKRPWPQRSSFGDRRHWWPPLITVWHVEPKGADAFTTCKHASRWKWHIWHWHLQIIPVQNFHRWAFERCELCGRRYPWGYSPVSHQWGGKRGRWFHFDRRAYHHECSALVSARRHIDEDRAIVHELFSAYRVLCNTDEQTAGDVLFPTAGLSGEEWNAEWRLGQRMKYLLGWKHDNETSRLVPCTESMP